MLCIARRWLLFFKSKVTSSLPIAPSGVIHGNNARLCIQPKKQIHKYKYRVLLKCSTAVYVIFL